MIRGCAKSAMRSEMGNKGKALSVRQPWAWLIVNGYKDIENRGWRTSYRGRIYVHAGKKFSDNEWIGTEAEKYLCAGGPGRLFYGAIIGEVTIVDCVTESDSPWFEGPIGWVLRDPVAYEHPILMRGRLGLFEVELDDDE